MKTIQTNLLTTDKSLSTNGALLIKSALSKVDVKEVRELIDSISDGSRCIQAPAILNHELLQNKVFLNKNAIDALKRIFGKDISLFPSFQVQINSYTQNKLSKLSTGLHVDAAAEVESKEPYLTTTLPAWVNIGCYLQDHSNNGWGGGIAVIPGSHKLISLLMKLPLLGGVLAKCGIYACKKILPDSMLRLVPTEPGDILIFDNRLLHTSVPGPKASSIELNRNIRSQTQLNNVPKNESKYAFYWFAGQRKLEQSIFHNNFVKRAIKLDDSYAASGGFNYKAAIELDSNAEYPIEFQDKVKMLGLTIAKSK